MLNLKALKAARRRNPRPASRIDLTGQRFGRLTVIAPAATGDKATWVCVCDCGAERTILRASLRNGSTQSCGCLREERRVARLTKHGDAPKTGKKPAEYLTWNSMKMRCSNPNTRCYKYYGGRGITVCERWQNSYLDFLADMGRRPTPAHSIDRIDVNGNYEPGNCRWATPLQQARNTRKYIAKHGVQP